MTSFSAQPLLLLLVFLQPLSTQAILPLLTVGRSSPLLLRPWRPSKVTDYPNCTLRHHGNQADLADVKLHLPNVPFHRARLLLPEKEKML